MSIKIAWIFRLFCHLELVVHSDHKELSITRPYADAAEFERSFVPAVRSGSGKRLHSMSIGDLPVLIALTHDGRTLVVACEHELQFWHTFSGQKLATIKIPHPPDLLQCGTDRASLYFVPRVHSAAEIFFWSEAAPAQ